MTTQPNRHTTPPETPIFTAFFTEGPTKAGIACKNSRTMESQKLAIFATSTPPNGNFCWQPPTPKANNFVQTQTVAIMRKLRPNLYFYSAKRDVDYRLTRGWTIDWPSKRKKVDYRLICIYIYVCIDAWELLICPPLTGLRCLNLSTLFPLFFLVGGLWSAYISKIQS